MKQVKKIWGAEKWIINEPEYCAKFLYIERGFFGSRHHHPIKKETFYCINGMVRLEVDGKTYILEASEEPVTIPAGTPHRFTGMRKAGENPNIILEISTHHDDSDVVRSSESGRES